MSYLRATTAALALLLLVSCVGHRTHPHGMPPGQAKKVGHAHGSGCGHDLVDGAWVSVAVTTKPSRGPKKK